MLSSKTRRVALRNGRALERCAIRTGIVRAEA
jgi:hypothetical protein